MSVTQQQLSYLKAMGIPVWVDRNAVDASIFEGELETQNQLPQVLLSEEAESSTTPEPATNSPQPKGEHSAVGALLGEMGMVDKPTRVQAIIDEVGLSEEKVVAPLIDCATLDWQQLLSSVIECKQCDLHSTRTQTVFGEGVENATWMIIGDAPKEEDDLHGNVFIGRSGELLNNMLLASGLDRSKVYLTNALKCRPPNNRDAKQAESKACYGYLKRQIDLVKPSLILIVGRIAAQHLLNTSEPLARLRGREHQIEGLDIPVVVTYHPAYLLRQPRDKYKSWEDLKLALSMSKPLA